MGEVIELFPTKAMDEYDEAYATLLAFVEPEQWREFSEAAIMFAYASVVRAVEVAKDDLKGDAS